jgi:aspartyl-tRNA(Asn)/glutamyl-tRNA(Gln) amidotransferase subunit B
MAKDILEQAYDSKKSPKEIVEKQGFAQVSDESTLSAVVEQVVGGHPKEVEKCKAGKTKILSFLVGQIMKETKGQANPKKVNDLLRKALDL